MKRFAPALVLIVALAGCGGPREISAILAGFETADTRTCQYLALELRVHGKAAVPAWIQLLENKEKRFALHTLAAAELGSLGADARDAVPSLIKYLRDGYPGMQPSAMPTMERAVTPDAGRMPARKALSAIGAPAIPALAELLKHSLGRTRQEAALALGQIGGAARVAVPELVRLLGDQDRAVATSATWALGEIGEVDDSVLQGVLRNLEDKEPIVRFESLKTLGKFGAKAKSTIETVRRFTGDPDEDVRRIAAETVQQLTKTQ